MRRPRLSIGGLMIAVGMLAVSFEAVRVAFGRDSPACMQVLGALFVLAFQVETYLLIRRRERITPFWKGFLAIGVLVLISLFWAWIVPRTIGIGTSKDPLTGRTVTHRYVTEGSTMAMLWDRYQAFASDQFERWPAILEQLETDDSQTLAFGLWAGTLLMPNLVLPAIGGLLAWAGSRLMASRRSWRESGLRTGREAG